MSQKCSTKCFLEDILKYISIVHFLLEKGKLFIPGIEVTIEVIAPVSSFLNVTEQSVWGIQVQWMASQGQELFAAFLTYKYYFYYPPERTGWLLNVEHEKSNQDGVMEFSGLWY